MTMYSSRMTMLSVRVDDEVVEAIDAWCSQHETPRSDFLREAVRRELNRCQAIDEAESLGGLRADSDGVEAAAFDAIEAWGPQEDWSHWHRWLDEAAAAASDSHGGGDDSPR